MTNPITPKTQEEWLEHFKELGKKHGEMLAQPFIDYFADKILLTKKEVEVAREDLVALGPSDCFLTYPDEGKIVCEGNQEGWPLCRLCKKLTQFVSQGDSEEKGGEDE